MRSLALIFLCFCLAVSGTASALPMIGMAMEPKMETTSMTPDCPDMAAVAAMPAADDGAGSVDGKKPDCCRGGGCACAAAHCVFLAFSPPLLHSAPMATPIVVIGGPGYTSPALARLIRPPVS